MEYILAQLELGTEHSLVLAEKIFEFHSHTAIQDFQRQIQNRLLSKTKQLKDIFSSKYQELLDCSELVNGITQYTKQIVHVNTYLEQQISNDCAQVLDQLVDQQFQGPQVAQKKEQQQPHNLRKVLMKLSNKVQKIQETGLLTITFVISSNLSQLLKQISDPKEKQTIAEFRFLFEQICMTVKKSVNTGNHLQFVRQYFKQNDTNKFAIVLDLILFHLNTDQPIEQAFDNLFSNQNIDSFELFQLNLQILDQLSLVNPSHLKTAFRIANIDKVPQFLTVKSFEDFQELVSKSNQENDKSFMDQTCSKIQAKIIQQFGLGIESVVQQLGVSDKFDFNLYESILLSDNVIQLTQKFKVESNIVDRFKQQWIIHLTDQLNNIFGAFKIDVQSFNQYLESPSLDQSQLRSDFKLIWSQQIEQIVKYLNILLERVESNPKIYAYDDTISLICKAIEGYTQTRDGLNQSLIEKQCSDISDKIIQLVQITVVFHILDEIWIDKWKMLKYNSFDQPKPLNQEEFIKYALASLFSEQNNQQQPKNLYYFIYLLEENLSVFALQQDNQLKDFTKWYIETLQDQFDVKIFENLSANSEKLIQNMNILSMLMPDKYLELMVQNLSSNGQKRNSKQLRRPVPQISTIDDNPNFVLFSSMMKKKDVQKSAEPAKIDQQGLQMWAQQSKGQAGNKSQQMNSQSQSNRFGQAFFAAKEKTTSLLFKQYQ